MNEYNQPVILNLVERLKFLSSQNLNDQGAMNLRIGDIWQKGGKTDIVGDTGFYSKKLNDVSLQASLHVSKKLNPQKKRVTAQMLRTQISNHVKRAEDANMINLTFENAFMFTGLPRYFDTHRLQVL